MRVIIYARGNGDGSVSRFAEIFHRGGKDYRNFFYRERKIFGRLQMDKAGDGF